MSEQDTQQPQANAEQAQGSGEGERQQQGSSARGFDKRRPPRDRSRHRRGPQQHGQGQQQPRRPEPLLNMDELRELVQLINEHGFTEFEFENEDFRVRLRRDLYSQTTAPEISTTPAPTPTSSIAASSSSTTPFASSAPTPAPAPGAQPESKASEEEDLHVITSPIVGTFYRAASPTSDPFVRMGSHVNQDTVVCIIEAMKLMNEIQAETSGEVVKIYVENGQAVEFGQPLFGIRR